MFDRVAFQNEWIKQRRRKWLAENGPCRKCGSSDDLEVDHIDPDTKTSHRIWSWSDERRSNELKKCQALCESCHKEKTRKERLAGHGTPARYRHGCRCEDCRAWKKRDKAAYLARVKLRQK